MYGNETDDMGSGGKKSSSEVTLPPFGLFQVVYRKILQGEETKSRGGEPSQSKEITPRIDLVAANITSGAKHF